MHLYASLSHLGISNLRVARDRKKIKEGIPLPPTLLVRDERNGRVIVADGYHRLCAVCEVNEDAWIPCRIVQALSPMQAVADENYGDAGTLVSAGVDA